MMLFWGVGIEVDLFGLEGGLGIALQCKAIVYEIWKRRGIGYEDGLSGGSIWIPDQHNCASRGNGWTRLGQARPV